MERADNPTPPSSVDLEISPNNMSRKEWEGLILDFSMIDKPQEELPNVISFAEKPQVAHRILSELYEMDLHRWLPKDGEIDFNVGYINLRRNYLSDLSKDIKKHRKFYLMHQLIDTVKQSDIPYNGKVELLNDLTTLYLLVGEHDKFLVGVRDGIIWKKITWPQTMTRGEVSERAHDLANVYILNLDNIGQREAILVPDNPVLGKEIKGLKLPRPAKRGEEILEEAFYNQRYIVPPEGAEVRFKQAGDAQRLIIMQRGNTLVGKLLTVKGDVFIWVDLDRAVSDTFMRAERESVRWLNDIAGHLTAEVYRDLVTAVELPKNRQKSLRRSKGLETSSGELIETEERPKVVYIPRIIRTGQTPEIRHLYDGLPRPVTPHKVSGHLRRANMTEKHRLELLEFERLHDIPVLKHVPTGYTFVRPFVVPSGEEIGLRELPTFIKRRIETQLQQSLENQLQGKGEA